MEKDEELIKIYNAIKDQVGKGSSLGTKSDDSYDNLQSNLDNALNNLALPVIENCTESNLKVSVCRY